MTSAEAHAHDHATGACPGAKTMSFADSTDEASHHDGTRPSQLRQWPIQLHLVSPEAPYFAGADILLTADCVAFAIGDFHKDHLTGNSLAIACPKLDEGQEIYLEKIKSLFDDARINTLTVMIMQVPCCSGLLNLAIEASKKAERKVPLKNLVVSLEGVILQDEWVES